MFSITRIYTDNKGDSHFEDVSIELNDAGDIGRLSETLPASGVVFREVAPTYDWNFHTAPQKQYIILLDGEIEIETSLGDTRIFKAGAVLLVEDTWVRGIRPATCNPFQENPYL